MEPDRHLYHHDNTLPPPPPPKATLHSRGPTSDLPPTPDYLNTKSSSQSLLPLHHVGDAGPLSSPPNGSTGGLLTPPSPNLAIDNLSSSSPTNSSFKAKQNKKSNPLTDLVDSEREYIELLAGIIRKVAGAWSRTNFPPKQLDAMFRGIESVYRANRGLLTRLKEIGPTPTSPKALGDLLMRWIDDLDTPYTKYCINYAVGFDAWHPILTNTRLPPILTELSSIHPPPLTIDSDSSDALTWTLDTLFALPRTRLKYYKKLYTRLLKSTQPGRSDHKLLTGAVEKLETLLGILAEREAVLIGQEDSEDNKTLGTSLSVGSPTRSLLDTRQRDGTNSPLPSVGGGETMDNLVSGSVSSSAPPRSMSSEARDSRDTILSSNGTRVTSSQTMSMPISNLERRLSTDRVLDIFTLKPKSVRLQMNPPSLPFTRSLRLSHDVEIHFAPRVAPDLPRVHSRGHIFLLTDLFLICERMTADERQEANSTSDNQDYDMWLLYPPLAGKHLRVSECPKQDNVLQIQVLKKEVLLLHTESKASRDSLVREFKECIEAANLLSPRASQPAPPPVPPLKSLSADTLPQDREPRSSPGVKTPSTTHHMFSPSNNDSPPWEQNRSSQGTPIVARQIPVPNQAELRLSNLGMERLAHPSTNEDRDGKLPAQSASQPQLHPRVTSGSSTQLRQDFNFILPSASNPYPPPPRVASNPQYHSSRQTGPPVRPATAPGQPHHREPSVQPNYPHFRIQNSASFQSQPPSHDQSINQLSTMPLRKSPSAMSLGSLHHTQNGFPPTPGQTGFDHPHASGGLSSRDSTANFASVPYVHQPHPRLPFPPSATFNQRTASFATTSSRAPSTREPSPPSSPIDDYPTLYGPVTSTITAQFKCKVFLQLHHGQWKSLGGARLKLYLQQPTNIKQLVVEAESKDKAMLISTIVLTDGVERVGKTGVAIELSDNGTRTGIVYMIQLRNEISASGLFDSLLAGSDRAAGRTGKG